MLSHLGTLQADAANRRAALRRGREAVRSFRVTSLRGFTNPDEAQAIAHLVRLRTANVKLKQRLVEPWPGSLPGSTSHNQSIIREFDARETLITQAFGLTAGNRMAWFDQIVQDWQRLDGDIRPRIEEVGGKWVDPTAYADLRQAAKQLNNLSAQPMRGLRRTRQVFDQPAPGVPEPMAEQRAKSLETLKKDATATHEALVALLAILRRLPDVEQIAN